MRSPFRLTIQQFLAVVAVVALFVFCLTHPTPAVAFTCQVICFLLLCASIVIAIAAQGAARVAAATYFAIFALYVACSYGALASFRGENSLPFFPEPLLQASYDAIFQPPPLPSRQIHIGDPFGKLDIVYGGGQSIAPPYPREAFYTIGHLFLPLLIAVAGSYVACGIYRAARDET
ncbi:hypothetical protein LOC68_06975 [Blastopirellula sp. JC732]|uniref:Uncharacterized protein n=1 Tax=Blastopirellula sediminis TaxID=2894196 RepID=A0A9X1MJC7_9BACT|nr:hypothetical protein [Blastopirellula sediminis]MCC9609090.1 hypothetical protein [Blastopirellula sediminis]MCC9628133.1 hypothetical protein [Blastopirellula sediminis]